MSSYDNLKLDNQLCFALYAATNAIVRAYRSRLGTLGLTYPQYLVLMVLWESEGVTVGQLAERLRLDSGTLTPIVKRLESAGFVHRKRGADDERVVNVYLTPAGRGLEDEVARLQKEVACQTGLTEAEFVELRGTLHALTDSIAAEPGTTESAA